MLLGKNLIFNLENLVLVYVLKFQKGLFLFTPYRKLIFNSKYFMFCTFWLQQIPVWLHTSFIKG